MLWSFGHKGTRMASVSSNRSESMSTVRNDHAGAASSGSTATRPSSGAQSGSTRMRARARLISLIGEELISDEPVAVVELVKNAYDADAREVEVRFEGSDPDVPQ